MDWRLFLTLALLVWNLLVACLYLWDKGQAVKGAWRVPEARLLLTALCFGGLGAMVASHQIRHKTKKWYFHLAWWLGLAVLVISLYLIWLTESGNPTIEGGLFAPF